MEVCDKKGACRLLRSLVWTAKSDVEPFRKKIEENFAKTTLPNRVVCQEKTYGNVICDLLLPELYSSQKIMLYAHGGSFVGGSKNSWKNFCASLAFVASCRIILPEFRLAPGFPYPNAVQDITSVIHSIVDNNTFDNDINIILAGDASGACLILSTFLSLESQYKNRVKFMLLLSPWLDLSSKGLPNNIRKKTTKAPDHVLSLDNIYKSASLYTYSSNLENPLVSPLRATQEDFAQFPNVYIQLGKEEILQNQCNDFKQKLQQVNVKCTIDITDDMMFCFQMADEQLPQAYKAMERLGNAIIAYDKEDL